VSLDFEQIGPYEVVRILGQGGMGTVYHAINSKTKEPVAVKVIASNMAQHQRFRRRFDAEIQTLLKLKHPSIVQLIGFGEERGMLFYSMEYVDGENLQQQLRREKSIAWERVVDIAIEVCSALKHAHDFGVIHRDLKPANLMINSQGSVKLTDFGIAKLFGASESTVEGSVLGTADYMSPEQAEGKPVSVRSDLYSLGSMCYAAISGKPPFVGKNIPEILFNVRYGTLVPLQTHCPDVPKELCDLIEELLRREPSMRPPTGLVVGNRLQSLRAGLSKRARDKAAGKTEVRNLREMTSIDMDEDSSLLSDVQSLSPGNETIVSRPSVSIDPKSKVSAKTNLSQASVAGPDDKTRIALSNSGFELSENPSGIEHMSKTNFTEVQEDDRRRSAIVIAAPEPSTQWSHWISIGGMLGLLIACGIAIFWFSRPPSANTLYQQISGAIATTDDEQLLAIEPVAERFQELYPNDARHQDVQSLLAEIDSLRSIRQMQRRAKRGGTDQLSPVEQGFLECIKAQEIDTELARRKLNALVTVFESSEKLSNRERQIVELAKRSLSKLTSDTKPARNPAIASLEEQMAWAEANLTPSTRAAWLQSLVELFADKVWAREIVESAKAKLKAIDKNNTEKAP
jgi:serine/threonine protein kinase